MFDPSDDEPNNDLIVATFPSLATSMSLRQDMVCKIFLQLELARQRQHLGQEIRFADHNAWDSFIAEYKLNMETTNFTIQKRKHLNMHIGSWNLSRHPSRKPESIWQSVQKKEDNSFPKLRVSTLALCFAMMVGKFMSDDEVIASTDDSSNPSETEDKECSEVDNEDALESPDVSSKLMLVAPNSHVPDVEEYPLLFIPQWQSCAVQASDGQTGARSSQMSWGKCSEVHAG